MICAVSSYYSIVICISSQLFLTGNIFCLLQSLFTFSGDGEILIENCCLSLYKQYVSKCKTIYFLKLFVSLLQLIIVVVNSSLVIYTKMSLMEMKLNDMDFKVVAVY